MNSCKDKISYIIQRLLFISLEFLVSCGGGRVEGGVQTYSLPTNSVTAVVNQSGGQVTLNDRSIATFNPGIVKDGAVVTITTLPPEASTSTEISSLSSRVRTALSIDELPASGSLPDAGITLGFPQFHGHTAKLG